MRYSALVLWLKYVNREQQVAGMFFGLLVGTILFPFPAFRIWEEPSQLPLAF